MPRSHALGSAPRAKRLLQQLVSRVKAQGAGALACYCCAHQRRPQGPRAAVPTSIQVRVDGCRVAAAGGHMCLFRIAGGASQPPAGPAAAPPHKASRSRSNRSKTADSCAYSHAHRAAAAVSRRAGRGRGCGQGYRQRWCVPFCSVEAGRLTADSVWAATPYKQLVLQGRMATPHSPAQSPARYAAGMQPFTKDLQGMGTEMACDGPASWAAALAGQPNSGCRPCLAALPACCPPSPGEGAAHAV